MGTCELSLKQICFRSLCGRKQPLANSPVCRRAAGGGLGRQAAPGGADADPAGRAWPSSMSEHFLGKIPGIPNLDRI